MNSNQKNDNTHEKLKGLSRRSFLKGMGLTSVGLVATGEGMLKSLRESGALSQQGQIIGPDNFEIALDVNGKKLTATIDPGMTLADVLRDKLEMTGTKIGCDRGACGACTVLLNGKTVTSCLTLAVDAIGQKVETIEGLEVSSGKLHKIQEVFIEHDGLQCGFCTSGMIVSAKHLLDTHPKPTNEQIRVGLSGNLCRCGTYPKVFDAVKSVSG